MEKWLESSGKYALCLCITELLQTVIRQEEVLHNKTQNELIIKECIVVFHIFLTAARDFLP